MNRGNLTDAFAALVSSLTAAFAAARGSIGDEFITRGWFGRNPAAGEGRAAGLAENQAAERTEPAGGERSLAITLGWEFPKEPSHDRDGPGHDIDR